MKRDLKHLPGILISSQQKEVRTLVQKLWVPDIRKTTVCIDSYREGVFRGRFYGSDGSAQSFPSLSQFLVMMEQMLERIGEPQSDTSHRSFSALLQPPADTLPRSSIRRGMQATFELQILFRQHTSWQGMILWKEQHRQQSFRSVLEMILLMDSALRETEEQEAG